MNIKEQEQPYGDKASSENQLAAASIPEAWWPDCYISDEGQIFTPQFDKAKVMTLTGEQVYQKWLIAIDAPSVPSEPTTKDRLELLEAMLLDLDFRQTLAESGMAGGDTV